MSISPKRDSLPFSTTDLATAKDVVIKTSKIDADARQVAFSIIDGNNVGTLKYSSI